MATEKRLIDANVLLACFEEEYKQSTYPYFHMDEIADEIIKAPPWMPWKWFGVRIASITFGMSGMVVMPVCILVGL